MWKERVLKENSYTGVGVSGEGRGSGKMRLDRKGKDEDGGSWRGVSSSEKPKEKGSCWVEKG